MYNLNSSYPITYHLNSSYPIIYHLNSSYPVIYHLNSSHPVLYHLNSSYLVTCHLNSSHPVLYHLNSSYPVIHHLYSSYLILCYRFRCFQPEEQCVCMCPVGMLKTRRPPVLPLSSDDAGSRHNRRNVRNIAYRKLILDEVLKNGEE